MLADDFLTNAPTEIRSNITSDLKNAYESSGKTQLSVMKVIGAEISKYGVITEGQKKGAVAGIVEKPNFEDANSNIASIGRYVLTPEIFDILSDLSPGAGGEIQLADAINTQAELGQVKSVISTAVRFDCGSVEGFLEAILHESLLRYGAKN